MSLTISGNGALQAVYLRQNAGVIEYSVGPTPGSYTAISSGQWPVTITNTNPGSSSILRVIATTNLTLTSSYGSTNGYLIAGSTYITFDGSGNTITLDGITSYPGFIQNGTSGVNGFANIIVQNFTTAVLNSSTLANSGAWLCREQFGYGVSGNTITGCTNNGNISGFYTGGIVGAFTGNFTGASVIITGCTNSGIISGQGAGGIAGGYLGSNGGSITITNCTNTGLVNGDDFAGGIAGGYIGNSNGSITIMNCTNTGVINGTRNGGITGGNFAYNTSNNCVISGCYSTGAIIGNDAGGIVGSSVGYSSSALYTASVDISNCYSLGAIATTCGGICGGYGGSVYTNKANIRISNSYSFGALTGTGAGLVAATLTSTYINLTATNTYVAAGTWSDTTANSNLTGTPTNISTNNPGTTWTMITAGTPYVLSAYNAALYSPNSASSSNNYTSAAGLFSPGYTYQLLYTSQAGSVATARVFASKGTAPFYNSYNSNTFTFTCTNGGTGAITATINNASTGVLDFIVPTPYPCFLEGSKILCFENNEEVYRPIESLRKGDLVKTIYNGYMPIHMIGTTALYNPGNDYRVANRLYKCSREKYPTLFEDLYITGCHSILVPWMTNDQWENTKAVNGTIFVTDNHFRLIACADEKAEPFNKEGFVNIYHVALENNDYYMNYGIYANGLLVESCSKRYLTEISNMRILGQEDCSVSENVVKVPFNMGRQLVDTY